MSKENTTIIEGDKLKESLQKKTQPPPMYKVMLNNDDYTPMEFVIDVLCRFLTWMVTKQTR